MKKTKPTLGKHERLSAVTGGELRQLGLEMKRVH